MPRPNMQPQNIPTAVSDSIELLEHPKGVNSNSIDISFQSFKNTFS